MKKRKKRVTSRVSIVRLLKEQDREYTEKANRIIAEAEGIATLHNQILARLDVLDKLYSQNIKHHIEVIEDLRKFTDKFFEPEAETVDLKSVMEKIPEQRKHGFTIFLEKLVNLFQSGKHH